MPSFKNIGLLAFFIGTTLASPTSHKEEKRQFLAPPPGCEDPAAFSTCASQSPIACLNPLPGSVAACIAFCEPCCSGEAALGCPENGEGGGGGNQPPPSPGCFNLVANDEECASGQCTHTCASGNTETWDMGTTLDCGDDCWYCSDTLC